MVTYILIDHNLAIDNACSLNRAVVDNLADLASAALLIINLRYPLADNAKIVQIGFDTVVRAAADCDLELMRQLDIAITFKEPFVNLFRQREGINQTVLAGCTLTGNNRTYFGTGAAGLQTCFRKECAQRLDVRIRNTLNLNSQTGGHCNLAAAVNRSCFGNDAAFFSGDLAVAGDNTAVEAVGGILVKQEAECFDSLLLLFGDGSSRFYTDFIDEGRTFQYNSIVITK